MSFALLFAVLMILWLVFGIWPQRSSTGPFYGGLILFVLLLLLGWKVFGPLVHP